MSDKPWIDATAADALPTNDVLGVVVAGREIALYTAGDAVYASDMLCTHGDARLCDGFLDGHEIECPLHQGKFDVRDRRATWEPACEPLRCHPVRIEGGRVFVQID